MPSALLPLHVSLSDWDGIVILVLGFGPFLLVAGLVVFLRIRLEDDEVDGQDGPSTRGSTPTGS